MESKTQSEPGSRIVITRGWCNGQSWLSTWVDLVMPR
jgi:hypothetical protein